MQSAVFIAHEDQVLRTQIRRTLDAAGYDVHDVTALGEAWSRIESVKPDLVILPWAGTESVRDALGRLRGIADEGPIRTIVIARREEVHNAVSALELGADDCLASPFTGEELLARVSARLRRSGAGESDATVRAGPIFLDKAAHCLCIDSEPVDLAPTEYRLAAFLLDNQGRVFSRRELLKRAWPDNVSVGQRTVDVHVRRLRQALEPYGCDDMIQTVRGFGYRLSASMRTRAEVSGSPRLVTTSTGA